MIAHTHKLSNTVLSPRELPPPMPYPLSCEGQLISDITGAYHGVHVNKLKEEHKFDGDECVIVGANVPHIVVYLTRNTAEFGEHVVLRDETTRVVPVRAMPFKLMKPVCVCVCMCVCQRNVCVW